MLSKLASRANHLFPISRQIQSLKFIDRSHHSIPSIACMVQLQAEKMAIVRNIPGATTLSIQVQISGRVRNLDRPKDEMVEKPLMRLQKSAMEKSKGRKKAKNNDSQPPAVEESPIPTVSIYSGPNESYPIIDPLHTSNEKAWSQDYLLKIGDMRYSIVVNPPVIERLHVHGQIFSGVPVVPLVEATNTDHIEWQWYRKSGMNDAWEPILEGNQKTFVPRPEDVGCELKLQCKPVQKRCNTFDSSQYNLEGFLEVVSVGPVVEAPPFASSGRLDEQHSWTVHPAFRVMTYNILADQYASTDTAKESIFFHCDNKWLEWQHRRPLVFKEILDYKPDIACLQEVDSSAFESLLRPGLEEFGLNGVYTNKAGRVNEGSAVFWRNDRFDMVAMEEMEMRKYFPKNSSEEEINNAPLGRELRPLLESSPHLCEALQKVGTIAQLILLSPSGPTSSWGVARPICVVNTHLFFHYAAPHIRTIHVWAMLRNAKRFISDCMSEKSDLLGGKEPCLVFCGDLNSDINDGIPGVVKLLDSGKIEKDYWDWKFGVDFSWGNSARGEEDGGFDSLSEATLKNDPKNKVAVSGVDLDSPFDLSTADDMITEFTNYVQGYQGLLDYIWYQNNCIQVKNVAPCPGKEQLGGYLPSYQYPSDHLAVVADLEFVDLKGDTHKHMKLPDATHMEAVYRNIPYADAALQEERIIAVPTDTIYGIAGLASSSKAIKDIYTIKKRDVSKPLAVCVADYGDISEICHTDHLPINVLKSLLPGPVTIVLQRRKECSLISDELNPGIDALAVRIPDFPFLRAICRQAQTPLALTSANLSGDQSPVRTSELGGVASKCALIFDHGMLGEMRSGSTIVDLRKPGVFTIIRQGAALQETIASLTGNGLVQDQT